MDEKEHLPGNIQFQDYEAVPTISPGNYTRSVQGIPVKLRKPGALLLLQVGPYGDGEFFIFVEESKDGINFGAAIDTFGIEPMIESINGANRVYLVEYYGRRPYVRASALVKNATIGATLAVSVLCRRR